MIVRKIKSHEIKRVQEFCALAFEYGMKDSEKAPETIYEEVSRHPQCRQDMHWQSQWAAFEDDDRTMLSTLTVIPYPAHFDGHPMLMMGIGGVSTLPQHRRRGGVRACFERALPDMYEQGASFSYLYPFSTAYYRKFGYETACEQNRFKLLLSGLPQVSVPGSCELLEPGVDLKDGIRRVDRAWQSRYNLMVTDEDIEYRWVDQANPFRDQEYTYLYRAADGEPKGYVTFRLEKDGADRNLFCPRMLFTDTEGFYGLLRLILSLASDHRYVIFSLPTDIELAPLLPEWSMGVVQVQREMIGMARAVNVEKVLRMARTRGEGTLVLEIRDGQIDQNNGRFEIRFGNGGVGAVERVSKPADIEMGIQDFSRLIAGRYGMDALPCLPGIRMRCSPEIAAKVFFQKPLFINRYF